MWMVWERRGTGDHAKSLIAGASVQSDTSGKIGWVPGELLWLLVGEAEYGRMQAAAGASR